MNLAQLVDTIETMILQHDYPGFEARALNLGLPEDALKSSPKVFAEALKYDNVFVKLASLRWFQGRAGMTRNHKSDVVALLEDPDEWVRTEAVRTLERGNISDDKIIVKISSLLTDASDMVRQEAAKACGKLLVKSSDKYGEVVALLRIAAADPNEKVRWKAQKALRQLGAYSVSA
jgi:hypothetical protein